MKYANLLKFTATGTSAATITFGTAIPGFRTLAQSIADGVGTSSAIKIGDVGVPFAIDDGAGNKELSLFTVTSATVLTRTEVLSSTAGGTTPATFTGPLTVYSSMPAGHASKLVPAAAIKGIYAVGEILTAVYPTDVVGTIQFTRTMLAAPNTRSLIDGAAASGVNSLPYTISSADAGFAIGILCSNQVSSVTGGSVPAQAVVRNSGTVRLFGTQSTIDEPTFFSYGMNSSVYKVQAPGAAIGCRISVHNKSPVMGAAYVKASIAPTDVSARDTAGNAYNAQVAGVVNNAAYDATNNPYGFRKATWNGQDRSRRLYPTNAVLPSTGYNNQEDTVISDVIPLPGYGGVGSTIFAKDRTNPEPYFIVRIAVAGTVGVDGLSKMNYSKMQALTAEWANSNGADTSLLYGNTLGNNVDAVDGSFGIPANGNGYPSMISIEWIYPSNITPKTILHPGDSLIEGYRWARLAVNRRNTNPLRPLHHVCLGGSTTRTESFIGNMYLYLQTQARPDYVLLEIISPNNYSPLSDFTNNIANADFEYNRLVEIAQFLAGLGIKMIWWVPVNYSPKVNPTDPNDMSTSWNRLYNKAHAYAIANGIEWMDINGDSRLVWVSGQTYNASSNATSWNGDGTHPSDPVGIEGFATIYGEKLAAIGL